VKNLTRWEIIKYSYDWRTIFKTVGIVLFFVMAAFFLLNRSYFEMKWANYNKSGVITGYIINRTEHTQFIQTTTGNKSYNDEVKFYYTFIVKGIPYYDNESIGNSIIIAQQIRNAILKPLPYKVTIHYNESDPHQSIIWFE
jgi:hypothetical protein